MENEIYLLNLNIKKDLRTIMSDENNLKEPDNKRGI